MTEHGKHIPSTGTQLCPECGHAKAAHGPFGCIENRNLCPCPLSSTRARQ